MTTTRADELLLLVRRIRRRWRLRIALQGLAIVVGLGLGLVLAGAGLLSVMRLAPAAVTAFRVLTWLALIAAAVRFLVVPLARRVTDEQVALYVEEHDPSLQTALVSAVEQAHRSSGTSRALADRLLATALAGLVVLDEGRQVERTPLRRASTGVLGAALAGMLLVALGPSVLRQAGRLLFLPWSEAAAATPYLVMVEPGDATVPKGGDVEITARLRGFTADRVDLLFREGESSEWQRVALGTPDSTGAYAFRFFDVTEQIEYTVEANGVRSPHHTLTVSDLPAVGRLVLELRYPGYTGLPAERIEPGGDLVVPKGTTVRYLVEPTLPTLEGRVILEPGQPVLLSPGADSLLGGTARITVPGSYRIELRASNGAWVPGSLSYRIDLLDDRGPSVRINEPGRDLQATAIEELFLEASATDDYGVAALDLVYQVNGGAEQTVALYRQARGPRREVAAGHTLFLEEMALQPGDVIAYYARASDADGEGAPRTARSDIYFVRIRPFGKEYRQAEQGGGTPMAGAGESPQGLSERQRELVAGTFRVLRDQEEGDGPTVREDLTTLALGQGRLHEQLQGLLEQMERRNAVAMDSAFLVIQMELRAAAPEMKEAEERLGRRQADSALAPEQRALQHLQRAEETFREVQVSMERNGGGGGAMGGNPNAEELADLFELETDKLQNQYESLQRAQAEQNQAETDEVLERLKELARRQQQEDERMRRAAQQLQQRAGSSGASAASAGSGQRQLAQEAEDLARRLERLERERPSPELSEAARSLAEAADAMRRSAGSSGSSAQSAAALDRLRQAAQALEDDKSSRQRQSLNDAGRRAAELADRQRDIAEDAVRATRGAPSPETVRTLGARKDSLATGVSQLERDLDEMARELRREEPGSARQLEEAARGLREGRVGDRIRFSKGLVREGAGEYARNFEEQITRQLDGVGERIAAAARALGVDSARAGREAVAQAGELVRGLESLGERLQQSTESQQTARGGDGRPQLVGPSEARQFARELRARREALDSLRAGIEGLGLDAGDLEAIGNALQGLERGNAFATAEGMERLQSAVLDRLKAFEFALRRRLGGDQVDRPLTMPLDDLPPAFREMVAEYYRSLARRGGGR
jgi:molybdenum-dependent DNA-binding transcriptional regulator ModE